MTKRTRRMAAGAAGAFLLLLMLLTGFGLWSASARLLAPSFKGITKDFSECPEETAHHLGKGCGNLRMTRELAYREVGIPAPAGGAVLPGWLIGAGKAGDGPAPGAVLLVHPGGADRRYMTRYARLFLDRNLDVLTFDCRCHGEAPCGKPGLTYGSRESQDVVAAYRFLKARYAKVFALGSSVGASSILVALPEMPELAGAIAENPFASFERLIKEAPEARGMPGIFVDLLIAAAEIRGGFDGARSPAASLARGESRTPVMFIHSRADKVVSWKQSEGLAALHAGPKTAWYPETGEHAAILDSVPAEYEKKIEDFLGP